jgi:predicted DCC family thiol-disulfide oxidoreductase YuxK
MPPDPPSPPYTVIYDGCCNLCISFVKLLQGLDQGQRFRYVPMQDQSSLERWSISAADCEAGMILLATQAPEHRWQGSAAAEKIATLLPAGAELIAAYRRIPGLKAWGDRTYAQIRDHRYQWFGSSPQLYTSNYPGVTAATNNPDVCSSCPGKPDC